MLKSKRPEFFAVLCSAIVVVGVCHSEAKASCSVTANGIQQMLELKKIEHASLVTHGDKYKKLATVTFKDDIAAGSLTEADIGELAVIVEAMIQKEEKMCGEYVVFYHGAGFAGTVLQEIRSLATQAEEGTALAFASKFKTVKTATGSSTYPANLDRQEEYRASFISVTPSLVGMHPNESASYFYLYKKNINISASDAANLVESSVLKGHKKAAEVAALVRAIKADSITRSLTQFFIKKSSVDTLAYFSAPFGIPMNDQSKLSAKDVLELLSNGPKALLEAVNDPKRGELKRMLNKYAAYGGSLDKPAEQLKFFDILQARMLITSKVMSEPGAVEQITYYPKQEQEAATAFKDKIRCVMKPESAPCAPLTSAEPALEGALTQQDPSPDMNPADPSAASPVPSLAASPE